MPAIVALALAVTAAILVAYNWNRNDVASPRPTTAQSTTKAPPTPRPLKQARWRVAAFSVGLAGDTTKKDRRIARRQARRASRPVRQVFNTMFLEVRHLRPVVHSHFEQPVAKAFLHARTKLPRGMTKVQTISRTMRIGVEARSAKRAAAVVTIVLKGRLSSKRVRIVHHCSLWLHRAHGSWKVLAFEAHQRPHR
jgi:hypothetical protein